MPAEPFVVRCAVNVQCALGQRPVSPEVRTSIQLTDNGARFGSLPVGVATTTPATVAARTIPSAASRIRRRLQPRRGLPGGGPGGVAVTLRVRASAFGAAATGVGHNDSSMTRSRATNSLGAGRSCGFLDKASSKASDAGGGKPGRSVAGSGGVSWACAAIRPTMPLPTKGNRPISIS